MHYRELIWEWVKRGFLDRYKDFVLGADWALFNSLLILAIHTSASSVDFNAEWGGGADGKIGLGIVLFSGMTPSKCLPIVCIEYLA